MPTAATLPLSVTWASLPPCRQQTARGRGVLTFWPRKPPSGRRRPRIPGGMAQATWMGATLLIWLLFPDEAAVGVLKRIGLPFSYLGNHEFDNGSARMAAGVTRRLQSHRCVHAPNNYRGAAVGTTVSFKRVQIQVAIGQPGLHRHQLTAAVCYLLLPSES